MFVEFNSLPDSARVWVYQSDREFTEEEIIKINQKAVEFINGWTRHGDALKGSFTIEYNQFLILGLDETFNSASGCSIDSSVRFVKEIEETLNVDLMDKMNVSFKDGDNINIVKLPDFQKFAEDKKITEETIVFNNMVNTKLDVKTKWEVPAKDSWHSRFLA